jgi:hypothetical protein
MEDNNRTWIIPKTTKLMPLDIAMPKVSTTLPSGLTVTFKKPENIDADAIERYVGIYRTVCYGTHLEIWGFACILNELLVSPLSTVEVGENRQDLHNLIIPILDSLDDRKWGSTMVTRPYDELEHENSIFAIFWRGWGIAVRRAISGNFIDETVPLGRMSDLLIDYAGSPEVLYKWHRHPEGELIALPLWVRNWFHHTENAFEPVPPSRHEIRRAAMDLVKLSFALEMTDNARREETRREQWPGGTTMIEYQWLSIQVFVDERRNEITVCQLGVFNGWSIEATYSNYLDSGEELVDFVLKLKQKAAPARLGC